MAASSIRLLIPAAPRPPSQNEMYWKPTLTSLRRPSSVISPGVAAASSSSVGEHVDVVALLVDLVRLVAEHRVERLQRDVDDVRVRDPGAVEAGLGLALLVLLARPRSPRSLASSSLRDGISAAMPPIANAPRRVAGLAPAAPCRRA